MRLQKRKGTVDGYEWRCRNQPKDNRHDVVRSQVYECPKCGKNMVMRERKERLMGMNGDAAFKGGENPHDILGLIDFAPVVRMACERKFNESEATTGFFLLLGQQGNKAVLDWVMKEGLIPSRYECPKCKKDMRLVERKGTIDGFEWRCRVQSKKRIPTLFAGV
ncbi:hypothetical protein TNCV_1878841 [Trichonephila clavipes]|nr:hypothetical protein TNCV_1878841 [Trichonephila clavipes]